MTLDVKTIRKPDTRALAAIHKASFYKGWDAGYLAESLRVEGTLALVAQGYAGFALLRIAAGEAYILTLAVRPDSRLQGIGRCLLEAAVLKAMHYETKMLSLQVNERNVVAIHLYEKYGFLIISRHPGVYSNPDGKRSDALRMLRLLEPFAEQTQFPLAKARI